MDGKSRVVHRAALKEGEMRREMMGRDSSGRDGHKKD